MDKRWWELNIVFVSPDGTESPLSAPYWGTSGEVEVFVERAAAVAGEMGLVLNCGVVEVAHGPQATA